MEWPNLDHFLINKATSFVLWGWRRHEIRKIDWLRVATILWFIPMALLSFFNKPAALDITMGIAALAVISFLQWQAELQARLPIKSHNAVMLTKISTFSFVWMRVWFLGNALAATIGHLIHFAVFHSLLPYAPLAMVGTAAGAFWGYIDSALMPDGPSLKKKQEKTVWLPNLKLSPIPIKR